MASSSKPKASAPISRRPLAGRRVPWRLPPTPLPSHPLQPAPTPMWPLLVAGLIVVFVLQGANFAYQSGLLGGAPKAIKQVMSSTFKPTEKLANRTMGTLTPLRGDVTPNPTNMQFGPADAPLTLTIFTDPACVPCRNTLNGFIGTLPRDNLRLVYKYWPQNPTSPSGGILLELARRSGKEQQFWNLLSAQRESPTSTRMLTLMEGLGLPLAKQQELLATQSEDILTALEKDATQARALGLGAPPQLVLNGYVLDGTILIPYRLPTYMERLLKNQSLVQSGDYWLNP